MFDISPQDQIKSLPAQVIPLDVGVILRRGSSQIKVEGERAAEVIEQIFKMAQQGTQLEAIISQFPESYRPEVTSLLDFLIARHFLVPCGNGAAPSESAEKPLEIFYWHFDPLVETVSTRIRATKLAIIGVNALARELFVALTKSNFGSVEVVDHPDLRDRAVASQWIDDAIQPIPYDRWHQTSSWKSIQCMIVCSDVGGGNLLHGWNQLCLSRGVCFLPVVLNDLIGFFGPLVLPGETACYECLTARENSNLSNHMFRRIAEHSAPDGRTVIGYHPTMLSVLANIAAFEIMRFFSRSLPGNEVGKLIEVNLLAMTINTRKVLKVPRCNGCSSMMKHPSISPYANEAVKTSHEKS